MFFSSYFYIWFFKMSKLILIFFFLNISHRMSNQNNECINMFYKKEIFLKKFKFYLCLIEVFIFFIYVRYLYKKNFFINENHLQETENIIFEKINEIEKNKEEIYENFKEIIKQNKGDLKKIEEFLEKKINFLKKKKEKEKNKKFNSNLEENLIEYESIKMIFLKNKTI